MHRVPGFQHHIIGDVHDVVDGAHAGRVERLAHPHRRRADLHIFDNARAVARAQVGVAPVSYTHLDVYKRQVHLTVCRCGFRHAAKRSGINELRIRKGCGVRLLTQASLSFTAGSAFPAMGEKRFVNDLIPHPQRMRRPFVDISIAFIHVRLGFPCDGRIFSPPFG